MRAGRCPPGVICFENVSVALIILFIGMIVMFFYFNNFFKSISRTLSNHESSKHTSSSVVSNTMLSNPILTKPMFSYSNKTNDVLMNPYEAPLRDNSYHPSDSSDIRGIPINVSTQAVESTYRQVGFLTRVNGEEMIIPLMGKPLLTHRDKWNFYTMSDKNNMIKLPVIVNNKSGTSEYGVDNLYNGDNVYVEGYNDAFKVTVYDNTTQRYIPYL
tara:strand:- start:10074 stop:10718 length:645 start_codon:yes stop_codon:yes gene_type:complete